MTTPQASGGFDIGTVSGAITLSVSGAISNLRQLQQHVTSTISNISSSFANVGASVSSFGSSLTMMMAPFAAGMGIGIKAAGNFQSSMAEIAARTGLTGDALDEIRNKALQMGADTSFSAQQSADAFLQLLSSGSSVEEAMQQIDAVMGGAAASGADLAFTADMLTDIMSQFNIEATESEAVMQSLVSATGASSATISTLSQGFANVGTVAAGFGLTIDETSAALATLNEQGIKGAEAGTALKTILSELGKPGPREELERLGIAFADANGDIRNFDDILDDINVALASKTEVEKREIIMELAGSYGQAGLSALLAKGGIDEMLTSMESQASFFDIAKKKMEGFIGQVTSLQGSIETLLIETFTPYINMLTPYVTMLVDMTNKTREWITANQSIVQPVLKMLTVLIALGPVMFGVGKAISFVGFLIGSLVNPIQLAMLAVTGFAAAWTTNFMGIRDVLQPIFARLFHWFGLIAGMFQHHGLTRGIQLFFTTFEDGSNFIGGFLKALGMGEDQAYGFGDAINSVVSRVASMFKVIGSVISRVRGVLAPLVTELRFFVRDLDFSLLISGFGEMLRIGQSFATGPLWDFLTNIGATVFATFQQGIQVITSFFHALNQGAGVFQSLDIATGGALWVETLRTIFEWMQVKISTAVQTMSNLWTSTLAPALQGVWNWIQSEMLPGLSNLWTWLQARVPIAIQTLANFWTLTLWPAMQGVWSWIQTVLFPMFGRLVNWLVINVPIALSAAAMFWNTTLSPAIQTAWEWIQKFLDAVGGPEFVTYVLVAAGVVTALSAAFTAAKIAMSALTIAFSPLGLALILGAGLVLAYQNNWFGFKKFIDEQVKPLLDDLWQLLTDINTIFEGVRNGNWSLGDVANQFAGAIPNQLGIANRQMTIESLQSPGQFAVNSNPLLRTMDAFVRAGSKLGGHEWSIANLIPQLSTGTNFVPQDMMAYLHQGEAVLPREYNPAAGGAGGGMQLHFASGAFVIHADSYAGGQQAARGFSDELMQIVSVNG